MSDKVTFVYPAMNNTEIFERMLVMGAFTEIVCDQCNVDRDAARCSFTINGKDMRLTLTETLARFKEAVDVMEIRSKAQ